MEQTTNPSGILFADVCGSVRLYERLGDTKALLKIEQALEFLSEVVAENSGTVVKTIGDELLCVFPNADDTAAAALGMLQRLDTWCENQQDPIAFRIGLHSGEVLHRDGDIFGDAVNLTARVVALSGDNQILTTTETVDRLSDGLRKTCRLIGPIYIKGKQDAVSIYEIPWNDDGDATVLGSPITNHDFEKLGLRVSIGDTTCVVNAESPSLSIGRSRENDLVLPSPTASRHHLTVELRGDKFILSDKSTNGTYIWNTLDNSRQRLLREQIVLTGEGWISLGQSQTEPDHAIRYQIINGD